MPTTRKQSTCDIFSVVRAKLNMNTEGYEEFVVFTPGLFVDKKHVFRGCGNSLVNLPTLPIQFPSNKTSNLWRMFASQRDTLLLQSPPS